MSKKVDEVESPVLPVVMKIERTARHARGCTRYGSAGKMVVMYGSTQAGWFERYFESAEKAYKHAKKKGWSVEPSDASIADAQLG